MLKKLVNRTGIEPAHGKDNAAKDYSCVVAQDLLMQ
jgi:hypothetical protein